MLAPVRRYAEEQLAETGEQQTTRASHLEFHLDLVEHLAPQLDDGTQDGLDAIGRNLD